MGWVSYLHRAATTYYLCCGQALEDSQGAGRIGLTHIPVVNLSKNQHTPAFCDAKVEFFFHLPNTIPKIISVRYSQQHPAPQSTTLQKHILLTIFANNLTAHVKNRYILLRYKAFFVSLRNLHTPHTIVCHKKRM